VRGDAVAQALRTALSLNTLQEQTIISNPAEKLTCFRCTDLLPAALRQVKGIRSLKTF